LLDRKAGFDPNQPRDQVGRWTSGEGGAGNGRDATALSANNADNPRAVIGDNSEKFKVPKKPPPTATKRNAIAREVARRLAAGAIGAGKGQEAATSVVTVAAAYGANWLFKQFNAHIEAYRDPPKTLEELREAAKSPRDGYDGHHGVEKTAAIKDGIPRSK